MRLKKSFSVIDHLCHKKKVI